MDGLRDSDGDEYQQPSSCGAVNRKQCDGSTIEVPCPESIISYNKIMGGVDRADQLRGYYRCRSKSRKFYKYVFFLFDIAIAKSSSCAFKDYKSFQLRLAKDLIGEYCSRRRRGRGATVIPFHSGINPSDWKTMGKDTPVDIVLFTMMFTIVMSSPPGFVV